MPSGYAAKESTTHLGSEAYLTFRGG